MSAAGSQWADLAPRVISGVILIIIGALDLYWGGIPFTIMILVVCGLIMWELARMFGAKYPISLGLLAAGALMLADYLPAHFTTHAAILPMFLAVTIVAVGQVKTDKFLFGVYIVWIMVGCYAFLELRLLDGLGWALWLVTVVVATDVAGYFAGRVLGGPKFWPRISPKKTWSGTAAGWVVAAIVGLIFSGGMTQAGLVLVPLSVAVSFASQLGDIAQSAAKRRKGIKDSSNLIPGHGGVFDRFDGMLGASVFMIPFWLFGAIMGAS